MKLNDLLTKLPESHKYGKGNPQVTGIGEDSRKIKKGDIFVAVKGLTVDGHKFIADAIKCGAQAVVGEKEKSKISIPPVTPYIKVRNSRQALGVLASTLYGDPSTHLKVIGVTGTDGKTTTSSLIYHILNSAGIKTGLTSTISAKIGKEEIDTGFHVTNPDPVSLQKLLKKMVREKCKFAVVEVTSHGLDQERVSGVTFDSAVLTNITHEHLDYHKTWEAYRDIKTKLFASASKFVVLNKDDLSFENIVTKVKPGVTIYSYALSPKQVSLYAQNIKNEDILSKFEVIEGINAYTYETSLLGDYNVSNILAAVICVRQYGLDHNQIRKAVSLFKPLVGRLENIASPQGFEIYVDFAHTPNALESVLTLLRKKVDSLNAKGRLIAIFGCAGERDVKKRALMGGISCKLADISVFTAEDPRSENVNKIIDQMAVGAFRSGSHEAIRFIDLNQLSSKHIYFKIAERGEAIAFVIQKLARKGDVVIICGKGHEKSMAYKGIEYPWSDQEAVKVALHGGVKQIKRPNL